MTNYNGILEALIRASQKKRVDSAFEHLLDSQINISKGIRSEASTSQQHLRSFLKAERNNDQAFPRVLSIKDNNFLGGSFARHTKVWPLDDVDIYFPLDGYGLYYYQWGSVAPYAVVSDGILNYNPVLNFRWTEGGYISSRKLITEFAKVLGRHYPNTTKVKADGQAVNIQMKKCETKDEDGLGFDVVPCFRLQPHDVTKSHFYLIPNGYGGWIHTNPKTDTLYADKLQRMNNETYRKVVKLMKYWNKERAKGIISSSYYIELTICKIFLERNRQGEYINKISHGVAWAFRALHQALLSGSQNGFVEGAPLVSAGYITDEFKGWVNSIREISLKAWKLELANKTEESINLWGGIFGDKLLPV